MKHAIAVVALALLCAAPAVAQRDDDSGFDRPPRDRERAQRDRGGDDVQDGQRGGPGGGRFGEGRGRRDRGRENLMFQAIDADGDQVISKAELRKAIKALEQLDADGDGNITLAEVTPERGPGGPGGRDPQQFVDRMMENDANGDGKLTRNEVPEWALRMLEGGDRNSDGAIDAEELAAIAENMGQRGGPGGGRGEGFGRGRGGGDPAAFVDRLMENDANGDGKLTPDEITDDRMRGMLRGNDANGDGAIDREELAAAMERMRERFGRGRGGDQPRRGGSEGERGRPDRPEFE